MKPDPDERRGNGQAKRDRAEGQLLDLLVTQLAEASSSIVNGSGVHLENDTRGRRFPTHRGGARV